MRRSIRLPGVIIWPISRVSAIPIVGWHVSIWHSPIHVVRTCSHVSWVMISAVAGAFRAGGPVAAVAGLQGGWRGWVATLVRVPACMCDPRGLFVNLMCLHNATLPALHKTCCAWGLEKQQASLVGMIGSSLYNTPTAGWQASRQDAVALLYRLLTILSTTNGATSPTHELTLSVAGSRYKRNSMRLEM